MTTVQRHLSADVREHDGSASPRNLPGRRPPTRRRRVPATGTRTSTFVSGAAGAGTDEAGTVRTPTSICFPQLYQRDRLRRDITSPALSFSRSA